MPIGRMNQIRSEKENKQEILPFEKHGIYKRFWSATFDHVEKRGVPIHLQKQFGQVKDWTDNIESNLENGIGMVLKGPVGTLKTTLAVAALQYHLLRGKSGFFVPMVNLMDTIFTLKEKNKAEWLQYEERIRGASLLVLDDFGAEYDNRWVNSKVDAIINERYNRMLPVIMTTNLTAKELEGAYTKRIYDRIASVSQVVNFEGESLRKLGA